jgi:hypothetical protein
MKKIQYLLIAVFGLTMNMANADVILVDYDVEDFYFAPGTFGNYSCTAGDCSTAVDSQGYGLGDFIARGGNGSFTWNIGGGIGSHSAITIAFDLAIIDSWDGDTPSGGTAPGPDIFSLVAGGSTVFSESFDNFDLNDDSMAAAPILGPASLGFNGGWPDTLYSVSVTFAHTGSSLSMVWSGMNLQSLADESWAIDNLVVTAVPEPGTLALLGVGLLGLGLTRRRKLKI